MLSFPKPEKKINKTSLAYVAAMLDAEGTITGTSNGHYIRVSIANINKDLIIWIAQLFGGKILIRVKEGRYPLYLWRCTHPEITHTLKLLLPFMRIKQEQARLAMIFRSQVDNKVPMKRRACLVQKIQSLNLRFGKKVKSNP